MLDLKYPYTSAKLITAFVKDVFPLVNTELAYWRQYASGLACPTLASQALSSIRDKKFHCQGGSIYGLYHKVEPVSFTKLVVALQTISDYLDNLCDRADVFHEQAFRQLHLAMTDALDTAAPIKDYYLYYPYRNDGGYLSALVNTCQQQLAKLPSYPLVKEDLLRLAGLYSQLQTYKHLSPDSREEKMLGWIDQHLPHYPNISPWEFAAATGSTLGIFVLCAAASEPNLTAEEAQKIVQAYFPWINGLHILLDYYIDSVEDQAHGDLNFTFYYQHQEELLSRLTYFTQQALQASRTMPHPEFNRTVIYGLLSMYLSDPKTNAPPERNIKRALLQTAGVPTQILHSICKLLRWKKVL